MEQNVQLHLKMCFMAFLRIATEETCLAQDFDYEKVKVAVNIAGLWEGSLTSAL